RQMGKNLVWLARTAHPGRKAIVWAASFHIMRNPDSVTAPPRDGAGGGERKPATPLKGRMTLGQEGGPTLGREMRGVGVCTRSGSVRGRVPRGRGRVPGRRSGQGAHDRPAPARLPGRAVRPGGVRERLPRPAGPGARRGLAPRPADGPPARLPADGGPLARG